MVHLCSDRFAWRIKEVNLCIILYQNIWTIYVNLCKLRHELKNQDGMQYIYGMVFTIEFKFLFTKSCWFSLILVFFESVLLYVIRYLASLSWRLEFFRSTYWMIWSTFKITGKLEIRQINWEAIKIHILSEICTILFCIWKWPPWDYLPHKAELHIPHPKFLNHKYLDAISILWIESSFVLVWDSKWTLNVILDQMLNAEIWPMSSNHQNLGSYIIKTASSFLEVRFCVGMHCPYYIFNLFLSVNLSEILTTIYESAPYFSLKI